MQNCTWVCVCVHELCCVCLFVTQWTVAARILCLWNFPGKNIRMSFHLLLQGIFLTQGPRRASCLLCLLPGRQFFTPCHLGKARKITLLMYIQTYSLSHCFKDFKLFTLFLQPCNSLFLCSLGRSPICQFADGQLYWQMDSFLHIVLNTAFVECASGVFIENLNSNEFHF